jgi:hypothetical protein
VVLGGGAGILGSQGGERTSYGSSGRKSEELGVSLAGFVALAPPERKDRLDERVKGCGQRRELEAVQRRMTDLCYLYKRHKHDDLSTASS